MEASIKTAVNIGDIVKVMKMVSTVDNNGKTTNKTQPQYSIAIIEAANCDLRTGEVTYYSGMLRFTDADIVAKIAEQPL